MSSERHQTERGGPDVIFLQNISFFKLYTLGEYYCMATQFVLLFWYQKGF